MFSILKFLFFSGFLYFVFLYFESYGSLRIEILNYSIETSISFVAVCIIIFVLLISFISQIVRFLVNLPSGLINSFKELQKRKAIEILHEIVSLVEVYRLEDALVLYRKYNKELSKKNLRLFDLIDYKFSRASDMNLVNYSKINKLQNYNKVGDLILHDYVMPLYDFGNVKDLERLAENFSDKNIKNIILGFINICAKEYKDAARLLKKALSDNALSLSGYNKSRACLEMAQALELINNGDQKYEEKLYEAFVSDRFNEKLYSKINDVSLSKNCLNKFIRHIEKSWVESPDNALYYYYLITKGDGSQGKVLDIGENLLKINSSAEAKMAVASEFLIFGFAKQAQDLISEIDSSKYSGSLKKALLFREALSTEAKIEKIYKFRKLIFNSSNNES